MSTSPRNGSNSPCQEEYCVLVLLLPRGLGGCEHVTSPLGLSVCTRGGGPHDFPRLLSALQLEAFLCLRLEKQSIQNDFLKLNYNFTDSRMLISVGGCAVKDTSACVSSLPLARTHKVPITLEILLCRFPVYSSPQKQPWV